MGPAHHSIARREDAALLRAPGRARRGELKLLEDEGLIERRAISAVPPWVEYSLTDKGSDLQGAIAGIDRWADRWASAQ